MIVFLFVFILLLAITLYINYRFSQLIKNLDSQITGRPKVKL